MRFDEREEAVSPVIGVILMVAITVILAAVIAVFVFGMAGDVQTTRTVAATAKQVGDQVSITYQGGPNHAEVAWINATCTDTAGAIVKLDMDDPSVGYTASTDDTSVTDELVVTTSGGTFAAGTGQDHVVITAEFDDGAVQVILDTWL